MIKSYNKIYCGLVPYCRTVADVMCLLPELGMPGLEVIKLEFILRLKIKRNDWLLADTCPQAANHCALVLVLDSTKVL